MIKNVSLNIEVDNSDTDFDTLTLELSPTQWAIVFRILGIEPGPLEEDGTISCYADTTLQQFAQLKQNPLTLQPTGGKEK